MLRQAEFKERIADRRWSYGYFIRHLQPRRCAAVCTRVESHCESRLEESLGRDEELMGSVFAREGTKPSSQTAREWKLVSETHATTDVVADRLGTACSKLQIG